LNSVSALRVGAVSYLIDRNGVHALVSMDSAAHWTHLGTQGDEPTRVDNLRRELRDIRAVAGGRTPQLTEFADSWGKTLLPREVLEHPPDVLVIVPHGWLHDLPLHLVSSDDGRPLGARSGITYASSHTLFTRCTERNQRRNAGDAAEFDATPPWTGPTRDRKVRIAIADVRHDDDQLFEVVAEAVAGAFCAQDSVQTGPASLGTLWQVTYQEIPDVLCLVAHGWVNPGDHLTSGLLVLDVGATSYFPVIAREITFSLRDLPFSQPPAALDLARPTVLLTAAQLEIFFESQQELILLLGCSAGSGRLMRGDQPASLAERFLQCGAASVVAPLWDIDISSTAAWADAFLQAWHRGTMPKALAARHALARLHDDGVGLERAGALTLRGDWL
jgi:CHAT domain-containing protein